MRLVFLGTPAVAVPPLEALLGAGHEVGLVVCQPDRPVGRSATPRPPAVKRAALDRGLELFQPSKVRNAAFRERLATARPEALIVVAYGRILTRAALELAPLGAINVHFSLLPELRGAAPVQWALARGAAATGVTTMQMNEQLDEGDILGQREVAVEPGEHAPALAARLADVGASLLVRTLELAAAGKLRPQPQDHGAATFAPRLEREDGFVDLAMDAREIEGRVRGFDPWPGVWVRRGRRRLRLVDARTVGEEDGTLGPGEVAVDGSRVVVGCGGGTLLELLAVQPEGRRVVSAGDAVNGRQLVAGERLTPLSAGR